MTHTEFMNLYTQYEMQFANSGEAGKDVVTVPAFHRENVSFRKGYTGIYSNGQNKKFPRRGESNYIFKVVADLYYYMQRGGIITFDEDVARNIGGYPKGAILAYYKDSNGQESDEGIGTFTRVMSLKDNNSDNFVKNPSFIDGVSWVGQESAIFPYYEKMQSGEWDDAASWTAPYNCWLYLIGSAFESAVIFITHHAGVQLTKRIKVAESTYLSTLRHGTTTFTNQFLCTKGDRFVCDLLPIVNKENVSVDKYNVSYRTGDLWMIGSIGTTAVKKDKPSVVIRYCPVRL